MRQEDGIRAIRMWMATELEKELGISLAAGGVVIREGRVLLVHRPRYDDWSLPKGKRESGETLLETACREVWEETGHRVEVTGYVGAVSYPDRGGPKVVLYWQMRAVQSDELTDTSEVDCVEWVPIGEAADRLTYWNEKDLLRRINEMQ